MAMAASAPKEWPTSTIGLVRCLFSAQRALTVPAGPIQPM